MEEHQAADGLALPGGGRDEGDLCRQQPVRPRVVVGGVPALPAEQHDTERGLAQQGQVRRQLDLAGDLPRQPQRGLDRIAVRIGPVDHEAEPQRQTAGPARQVVRVVGRVPLVGPVVDGVEVRRLLGVDRPRELRGAVEQGRAVERRVQPLVRVDHEGVGELEAVVQRPDRRCEDAGPAVGAVDVEPQAEITCGLPDAAQVVDDPGVRRAARRDDRDDGRGVRVSGESRTERIAGQSMVGHVDDERVDVEDVEGVPHRGVHLVADGDPQPLPARRGTERVREPAAALVAGDGQGREVPGRASGHEGASRLGGHPGSVSEPAQHLVLRRDRTRGLEPGDPLQRRRATRPCRTAARPSWGPPG